MKSAHTTSIVLVPDGIRIPGVLPDLSAFRCWMRSADFPEKGRIDWIAGDLEVDMSPEEINTHGTLKAAIAGDLRTLVEYQDRGVVFVDSTRITCPLADISVEPDVVVVLFESVDAGRVKLVPSPGSGGNRCVEIQGPPDLVVECVSDSSVAKDQLRLRNRYATAGIPEYWIVDARRGVPVLKLLRRVQQGYREVTHDRQGYVRSPLLGVLVRIEQSPPRSGLVRYRLSVREG